MHPPILLEFTAAFARLLSTEYQAASQHCRIRRADLVVQELSVRAMCEDVFGIVMYERKFIQETYQNWLVVANYQQIMEEAALDEDDVIHAEREWVNRLSIKETAACLAYHFRRDRFCEGSLICEGIANGCILRLMERSHELLTAIP